jgi:hypothetical protein
VSVAEPGVRGCLRCRVDHDGQVSWARSCHRRRGRRPVVVPPWLGRGKRERERDEKDDKRGGVLVSERERVSARGRAVLLFTRPSMSERALLGHACCWAEQGRRRGSRPALPILFFFFKNVNSASFCLFQWSFFVELQNY